jgi:hypothetical protein
MEAVQIVTGVYHHNKSSFFTHTQITTSKIPLFNNTHCEEIAHLFGTLNNAVHKTYKSVFWKPLL